MSTRDAVSQRAESLDSFVAAGALQADSPALQSFVIDARNHSGLDPTSLDPDEAEYSLLLPDGRQDSLRLDSAVLLEGEDRPLRRILAPQLRYDQASLARAIWAVESFDGLQEFLRALRVLLRYSRAGPDARLTACVVPIAETLARVARIAGGETTGSGGELLADSVTRSLGLRRKLLLLDYQRRLRGRDRSQGPLGRTRGR